MGFLNTILNIIFPAQCASCGKKGTDLCLNCLADSPPAGGESADWIFSVYDYHHPSIKKSLWLLKYNGKKRLAKIFAEVLSEKISEELSELGPLQNFRNPVLIPIPLSSKRRRERGYNQAELICEEIIKLDSNNLKLEKNILIKIKENEHQARIRDRRVRLKNIIGCFAVKNERVEKIKNRNIVLIDDITTTGATLLEAKKVLKRAGARKIIAFTVAH